LWLACALCCRGKFMALSAPCSMAQGFMYAGLSALKSSSHTWPAASRPSAVKRPGFKVSRLKVWRVPGLGAGYEEAPVPALSPVGRSMQSNGAPLLCIRSSHWVISCVPGRSADSVPPIPSIGSIAKSKVSGGSVEISNPADTARWREARASGGCW